MADPILHIKDSYYFEVPKLLYPYEYRSAKQFPPVWISLDPEFQSWEFERLYPELSRDVGLPAKDITRHEWEHWQHADGHVNFAKPYDVFLEEKYQAQLKKFYPWKNARVAEAAAKKDGSVEAAKKLDFGAYLNQTKENLGADLEYQDIIEWRHKNERAFNSIRERAGGEETINTTWKPLVGKEVPDWSKDKIVDYNKQLSGRILIPQPFATMRNFYEPESGFAISKFMIIQAVVGLILVLLFSRFAKAIEHGKPAKGKLWNLLETFLLFIRDQVVRPALGHHDEGHGHAEHGETQAEHSQGHADEKAHVHGQGGHGPMAHAHAANAHAVQAHADPATKFLPLLWTIFFFVLGCNLMGMLPWAGSPTASFSVTLALATITFATVVVAGMLQFGFVGFFLNLIPGMDLPWYMAIVIKPMLLLIELLGLCIKHAVLAVRLLANMVAGHLVILGIMGLAFGVDAAMKFSAPGVPGWQWAVTAVIAVVATAAFSLLELFVAFLQAFIITFLSALFIAASIHKH